MASSPPSATVRFRGAAVVISTMPPDDSERSADVTGTTTWPASRVLLDWLEDDALLGALAGRRDFRDLTLLDISAGAGAIALAAAAAGARRVRATELRTLLPRIAGAARLNAFVEVSGGEAAGGGAPSALELVGARWGERGFLAEDAGAAVYRRAAPALEPPSEAREAEGAAAREGAEGAGPRRPPPSRTPPPSAMPFDLALASDLLFIASRDGLERELAATLAEAARGSGGGVLVAWEPRRSDPAAEEGILRLAATLESAAPSSMCFRSSGGEGSACAQCAEAAAWAGSDAERLQRARRWTRDELLVAFGSMSAGDRDAPGDTAFTSLSSAAIPLPCAAGLEILDFGVASPSSIPQGAGGHAATELWIPSLWEPEPEDIRVRVALLRRRIASPQ
jgi:hypothetical protein